MMLMMMIKNKKTLNTNIFETLDLGCFADPTNRPDKLNILLQVFKNKLFEAA